MTMTTVLDVFGSVKLERVLLSIDHELVLFP
jgi:hypothetical protein